MRKIIGMLVLAAYAMMLAGCNTIEGFGRDVERAGDKIESKASAERRY